MLPYGILVAKCGELAVDHSELAFLAYYTISRHTTCILLILSFT
jgi:hypothetical protein